MIIRHKLYYFWDTDCTILWGHNEDILVRAYQSHEKKNIFVCTDIQGNLFKLEYDYLLLKEPDDAVHWRHCNVRACQFHEKKSSFCLYRHPRQFIHNTIIYFWTNQLLQWNLVQHLVTQTIRYWDAIVLSKLESVETHADAAKLCASDGDRLLLINSEEEFQAVRKILSMYIVSVNF